MNWKSHSPKLISERSILASGPYYKTRGAETANQSYPFYPRPVQPFHKIKSINVCHFSDQRVTKFGSFFLRVLGNAWRPFSACFYTFKSVSFFSSFFRGRWHSYSVYGVQSHLNFWKIQFRSRITVSFSEQIMYADKYPSISSRQMKAIIYILDRTMCFLVTFYQ